MEGEDRGLRDLGQPNLVFWSFEAELRELVAKRVIGFVEGSARDRELVSQFFAHADGLGSLSGEEKCKSWNGHE